MSQLKISDVMEIVEAIKKEVKEIKAKSCCKDDVKTSEVSGDVTERLEAVEAAIVLLKKEIRESSEIFNNHIIALHK